MEPIEEVFHMLIAKGFAVKTSRALEVFGGAGDWQTRYFADEVLSLEIWEIDDKHLVALRKNLPSVSVRICDSFKEIQVTTSKYNVIVIDNPQSVYCDGMYCEHFELFPHVFRIAEYPCAIIVNVNMEPYDLREGSQWWERRKAFYGTESPEKLSFVQVDERYRAMSRVVGRNVQDSAFIRRNERISYYLMRLT